MRLEGEVEDLKLALANTKADLKELTDARVVEGQREEEAAPQAVPPGVLLIQPRVEIAPQRPGTITRQPTGRPRLANLLGPTVHNLGDQLLVTGSVHNIGTADARQTLVVTLYGDGEELDFQDLWIELAPGGEQNYTFQFSRRGSSTTSYSAKATFE
ncbi:MAG TPA: CARDB domain-containing protein [Thermoanaerobaculia bacterium]|nr:CARDB domain-containing protein [Thermoanaerobaculia bacterium]